LKNGGGALSVILEIMSYLNFHHTGLVSACIEKSSFAGLDQSSRTIKGSFLAHLSTKCSG